MTATSASETGLHIGVVRIHEDNTAFGYHDLARKIHDRDLPGNTQFAEWIVVGPAADVGTLAEFTVDDSALERHQQSCVHRPVTTDPTLAAAALAAVWCSHRASEPTWVPEPEALFDTVEALAVLCQRFDVTSDIVAELAPRTPLCDQFEQDRFATLTGLLTAAFDT